MYVMHAVGVFVRNCMMKLSKVMAISAYLNSLHNMCCADLTAVAMSQIARRFGHVI
jgi:hypothetical protein